ncbi:MAG: energy transducer TonB [Longimicrobiales bacterium]
MTVLAFRFAAIAFLLAFLPLAATGQKCPDVDPATGYALSAHSGMTTDSTWLTAVARAAAYRWPVPSRRRNAYAGWERVERRLLPPEPRWADDWSPEPRHRARLRLTLLRDAKRSRVEIVSGSGDKQFDSTLPKILAEPMPASPAMPGLPNGTTTDSLVVELTFGEAVPGAGVIRFAAVQTRGALVPNTLQVMPPPGQQGPFRETTVKYDIREDGRVDATSLEFVRSPGRDYEDAVRAGLLQARFTAPTSNCRPIAQTMVQTFGGR